MRKINVDSLEQRITDGFNRHYANCHCQSVHDIYNFVMKEIRKSEILIDEAPTIEPKWHWVKDNDLPKDRTRVWCIVKGFCGSKPYGTDHTFVKDLYRFDNYDFEEYKGKHQWGFVEYDSEYGSYLCDGVICWTEVPKIPEIPEELKEK